MIEQQYKDLLHKILREGELHENRTATRTFSTFGERLVYDVSKYFPLITSKFVDFKIMQTEFEWFITGQTDIKLFKERGIKIWDQWADPLTGALGPVYGYQMLNYNSSSYNQLEQVVEGIKHDPYSRRHIITLWNPLQLHEMALPPCYLYFQFRVSNQGHLDMFAVQRSADMFAGIPYDMGLFALFLIYVAGCTRYSPGVVTVNIADAHIYEDHVEGVMDYLARPMHELPVWENVDEKVKIRNYVSESRIKIKIAK